MDQAYETLVTQFRESGLTQETFCKNNDISVERLRYYLYKKKTAIARNDNHGRNRKKPRCASLS